MSSSIQVPEKHTYESDQDFDDIIYAVVQNCSYGAKTLLGTGEDKFYGWSFLGKYKMKCSYGYYNKPETMEIVENITDCYYVECLDCAYLVLYDIHKGHEDWGHDEFRYLMKIDKLEQKEKRNIKKYTNHRLWIATNYDERCDDPLKGSYEICSSKNWL